MGHATISVKISARIPVKISVKCYAMVSVKTSAQISVKISGIASVTVSVRVSVEYRSSIDHPSRLSRKTRTPKRLGARAGLSSAIIERKSPIAGDPEDPRTKEEDPAPPTCLKSTEDRRLRQPERTPLRDRGDGPSLSQSGSSVQTVGASRLR